MSKNLINNKKLAVIGCSGLVGSSILRCALEKGYEVNGTMRNIEDSTKINYLKKLKNFEKLNLFGIDYILNLQGDEPSINVEEIKKLNNSACENKSDVATLACELNSRNKLNEENVVKVQTEKKLTLENYSKAIKFFRRSHDLDSKNIYQHIGIYQYKSSILKKFVELKQTKNETKNALR